jgi:energy-coupling factor transporter ATP-binding protein EcfA2
MNPESGRRMNPQNNTEVDAIQINKLTFSYGESGRISPALRGIDLSLAKGSLNILIGPSGCGKSTLLKCLTGVIPHLTEGDLSGEIYIHGRKITGGKEGKPSALAKQIGFVMQEPDHQIVMTTAEDDVAFGPENQMTAPTRIREIVDETLQTVDLADRAECDPAIFSGGEKQRLAIGGVLAMAPDILVFDEPVSQLDRRGREMFAAMVIRLRREGKTMLIAEHDYAFLTFADRWILMKGGHILATAAPSECEESLLEERLWR